jgi:arylsulfatase A-like enzyme
MGSWRGVKRDSWEGGHRVPYVARWPGRIKAGSSSSEVICQTDLMSTLAALTGYRLPDDSAEDSYNILPLLLGEKLREPVRPATVLHSARGYFALRQGPWVFIDYKTGDNNEEPEWFRKERGYEGPHTQPGELYHLGRDPGQKRNVYAENPEVVGRMKALLEKYKQEGRSRT